MKAETQPIPDFMVAASDPNIFPFKELMNERFNAGLSTRTSNWKYYGIYQGIAEHFDELPVNTKLITGTEAIKLLKGEVTKKVICVGADRHLHLTYNKKYDVVEEAETSFTICNDVGYLLPYPKTSFRPVTEQEWQPKVGEEYEFSDNTDYSASIRLNYLTTQYGLHYGVAIKNVRDCTGYCYVRPIQPLTVREKVIVELTKSGFSTYGFGMDTIADKIIEIMKGGENGN